MKKQEAIQEALTGTNLFEAFTVLFPKVKIEKLSLPQVELEKAYGANFEAIVYNPTGEVIGWNRS